MFRFGFGFGLTTRRGGAGAPWSPLDLGSSLLAWWDSSEGVSLSGSAVTAWADRKNGYSATQGISASRPTYSATSFGGAPGLSFDGVDDRLSLETQPFPSGANPSEVWCVVQQDALAADTTTRQAFAFGGGSFATSRRLYRTAPGGTNRANASVGNNTTGIIAQASGFDFSGRHLLRATVTASLVGITLDDGTESTNSVTPNTRTTRVRIGAGDSGTASEFWLGKIRDVIVTEPLSSEQAAQLQTFLLARRAL